MYFKSIDIPINVIAIPNQIHFQKQSWIYLLAVVIDVCAVYL